MAKPRPIRVPSSAAIRTRRPVARVRSATGGRRPTQRTSWLRWLGRIVLLLVVLCLLAVAGVAGTIAYYDRDLPDVAQLRDYHPPQLTRVVDRDEEVLGEIYSERRTVVPLDRIPRVLVLSVLAAEDADFYRHEGLDYSGLFRAVFRGILSGGHFRGTSTITQQVVKNLLLDSERSMARKIRELILARRLEEEFSKDEILALYLNYINFGHGRYGVQEAARFYFGKDVSELTLAEASLLAGIPQSPTHLSPRTHMDAARRRQSFVLDQLELKREEYWPDLTAEEIREARETRIELAPLPESRETSPEIVDLARRFLTDLVGEEASRRGGYTVHTTIDQDLQVAARASLLEGLTDIDERTHVRGPIRRPRTRRGDRVEPIRRVPDLHVGGTYDAIVTGHDDAEGVVLLEVAGHSARARLEDVARWNPGELAPSAFVDEAARVRVSVLALPDEEAEGSVVSARLELGPQGAVVVIEPRTRDVLALVGSYEPSHGFDRARLALRQPGSTFKPFVYAMALRSRRYTPATRVLDAPVVDDDYVPRDYATTEYRGEVRLREALAHSLNPVALRLITDLTPVQTVDFIHDFGITAELEPVPVLALGASEVRPIELANAYACFAAGGRYEDYRIISRIVGPDGNDVPLPPRAAPREVMTAAEAYLVTSLMTSVVREGTARAAARLGRPAAGKTGTSNEARDAWFAGFTPDVVSVVWVGYDDHRPLGGRESGARSALPIWMSVVRAATQGRPAVEFPRPEGLVTARIDPASGLLAYADQPDAIDELFLTGTEPTEVASDPAVLDPTSFLMEQLGMDEATPPPAPPGPEGGSAP